MYLDSLFHGAEKFGASDLHLIVGVPPAYRVNGEIILADQEPLDGDELTAMVNSMINDDQRKKYERDWELCISLPRGEHGRVRATIYRRNGNPEFSFRFCSSKIPTRAELGLPAKLDELVRNRNGLILVTGPTGSGKSTTLNYMVDRINRERNCKIITIEDPIEYSHVNDKSIVVQLEVMTDTHSFNSALVHVLRQDPDVIVVGELRGYEAVATALAAAETGHLVLATVHAANAIQTVERIVGVYEGNTQRQILLQLANTLHGIISQELFATPENDRRVLAYELLLANAAVRSIIRQNDLAQLSSVMQTSAREGMVLMDTTVRDLYARGLISYDMAASRIRDPKAV